MLLNVYRQYFPIKKSIQINIWMHTYMISICFLLFILIIELDSHIQKCLIHSEESITCHCDSTLFEIKLFRLEAIIYPIYNFLFFICSLFTNIAHFFPWNTHTHTQFWRILVTIPLTHKKMATQVYPKQKHTWERISHISRVCHEFHKGFSLV